MRMKTRCLIAIAAFGAFGAFGLPAVAAEDGQPAVERQRVEVVEVVVEQVLEVGDEAADVSLDFTPAEGSEAEPALLLAPEKTPVTPQCKGCPARYNGFPRASCDPCCYVNDIGVRICLS
jgi:hypothetical protein